MRVYQSIHKYGPHIPWFEQRYGIDDNSNHSFSDLQKLIIEDGYASAYVLQPALEGKTNEVFFTVWNYERMQFKWAQEQGMKSTNLQEIKQAQIEAFKPDVFYDFSGMLDKDFLKNYPIDKKIIKVAWYAIILEAAEPCDLYDVRVSLHRPFVRDWLNKKLPAFELQPAFDSRWEKYNQSKKNIDVLFYGQFLNRIFRDRNTFMINLMKYAQEHTNLNIKVHLQLQSSRMVRKRILGVGIPKLHEKFPPEFVVEHALPPIYGEELYKTIGQSKFVINGYGSFNQHFKSNMRLFESIGCGSLLISERGKYPEGFVENTHYTPFDIGRPRKLLNALEGIIQNYTVMEEQSRPSLQLIKQFYSKQKQWERFQQELAKLS